MPWDPTSRWDPVLLSVSTSLNNDESAFHNPIFLPVDSPGTVTGKRNERLDSILNEPDRVNNTACSELPSGSVEALLGFDFGTRNEWTDDTDSASLFPELDGQTPAVDGTVWGDWTWNEFDQYGEVQPEMTANLGGLDVSNIGADQGHDFGADLEQGSDVPLIEWLVDKNSVQDPESDWIDCELLEISVRR